MKKFYRFLSTVILGAFLCSGVSAQPFTGGVFSTIPAGGPLSVAATWVGGIQPPDNCMNCQILLFGNCTVDMPGIILTNHCQVIIEANGSLTIDQRVQIYDSSQFIIGSDALNPATLTMNAEADLDTTSTVRLANNNCIIDATSGATSASDSLSVLSGFGGGIYYINSATTYSFLINAFAYGDPFAPASDPAHPAGFVFNTYTINCNIPSPPMQCFSGGVYGPAISGWNAADSIYEFNVTTILPVELVAFAAILNSNQTVSVSWATSQEINSAYYEVQRSGDGSDFQSIGTVKAKGFSSITSNYAYADLAPLSGTSYYRLKMVDLDGKFKYSKIATVSTLPSGPSVLVLSNPFNDEIRLQINTPREDQVLLSVTDMSGKTYIRESLRTQSGGNLVNLLAGSRMSPGYTCS